MNKISINNKTGGEITYQMGDLFQDNEDEEIYIFCCIDYSAGKFAGEVYNFISLSDGNRFSNPMTLEEANQKIKNNFKFLGRDAKIDISFN